MSFLYRIIRYPVVYFGISVLLVLLVMTVAAWQTNLHIEKDREIPLVKVLGTYAATIDEGTVNSRAMGAAILFGLQNQDAKKLALGQLPPDASAVSSALDTLRTLYFADTVFLVNAQGIISAYSSNDHIHGTGRDLSSLPCVQLAMRGTPNVYPIVDSNGSTRGIYLAAPLRAEMNNASRTIGVVVVKVGSDKLDALLNSWSDGIALLLSPQGVVFAASRNDWLFRLTGEISAHRIAEIQRTRHFGKAFGDTPHLSLPFTLDMQEASIDGVRHAVRSLPLGWNDPEGDWMLGLLERRDNWWINWNVLGVAGMAGLMTTLALFWLYTLARHAVLRQENYRELESAQIQLRKSESRLHAILDNSPIGIWLVGTDGRYHFVNDTFCNAVGVPESKFLSTPNLADILDPEVAASCIQSDRECLEQIEPHLSHEVLTFVDGKQHLMEITKVRLHDSTDGVEGIIGISIDITERKLAEMEIHKSMHQLEEKEMAKTRFLAAAGHDLRQPLAAANLFIDALKITSPTPQQETIIQRLDQAMSTFNGLLDALLNVSKLDAGMIKPEYKSINVSEVFNWVEQNFTELANEKHLGFRLYFPMRETLVVRCDIGLIKSVLLNLVSNAIKFASRGTILVSARRRGSEVLFQVWDTGIGIKEENIQYIFDEFYQINNQQRDRTRGLGLGLAIAQRAISLLGGKITCRSRVGSGSVFEFRLPLDITLGAESQREVIDAPQEDILNSSLLRGKRFVVVEDDVLVAQALVNLLEGMGGEVMRFHTAEDALRHANIDYAEYFISDYMLGGTLNGIQFLNLLRQKLGKPINAVLITGDTSSAILRNVENFDWPILHKPVNTSRLISILCMQG